LPGIQERKFDLVTLFRDWFCRQGVPAGERKRIFTLAFLFCLGVALMLWAGRSGLPEKRISSEPVVFAPGRERGEFMGKTQLEIELATVLSRIKGVGQVKVTLVPAETTKEHWLFKETREERTNRQENGAVVGREERVQREPVFRRGSGGVEEPVRIWAEAPAIAGVLVVAEGAEKAITCRQLWEATATVLGIPLHRVMVLPWGE
jgi:stage III sporulation protein AG